MHFWLVLLLLAQTEPAEVPGRVCIGEMKSTLTEGSCASTTALAFDIAPSDKERLFVWTSADLATAHLGVVPAKATRIELDPRAASTLQLTLEGERSRGWPGDVTITAGTRTSWKWVLDAKAATRLRRLVVPRGPLALQLSAAHHRVLRRPNVAATEDVVNVGELRLVPLPVARGVVVDAEGKAIANAAIARPDGTLCVTANEQGAFQCELEERPPEALLVSASGRGVRELALPRRITEDVDLGRITLTSARAIALKIVRPEPGPATVTLFLDAKERHELSKVKSVEIREREEEVRFEAGEGQYQLLVAGSGPLERLEVPLEVKEGGVEKTITVEPYQLVGNVSFGDEPAEGTLEILSPMGSWRETVTIAGGPFAGTMWQPKKLRAFVKLNGFTVPELVESPELGADPSRWDLRLEKRMLVGRVLDAETKAPVPGVEIMYTGMFGGRTLNSSLNPEADGAYRILAATPGTFSLRVNSREHAAYVADIEITKDDRTKVHDILLERGVLQPLEIVTPAGAPVGGATLLEGVQPDGHNPKFYHRADPAGRYLLRGKPGETRLLYAVPQGGGAIAIVRVQIPRGEAKPVQVVLSPAVGSLRVRTVNANDELAPAPLVLRWNGEFLPNAILRFVTGNIAHTFPSGENVIPRLPAGTYEIWALEDPRAERALIAAGGTTGTPARVGLSAGEQSVTVKR